MSKNIWAFTPRLVLGYIPQQCLEISKNLFAYFFNSHIYDPVVLRVQHKNAKVIVKLVEGKERRV